MAPIFPDKLFLQIAYPLYMGKYLRLKNPQTYNEKLQWLKLYNHNPEYSKMVDKYEAKKYVASVIGEEHIIPTLGVYNSVDEIPWDSLPNQFVLKCTHDSGGIVICKDKKNLDIIKARKKLAKSLAISYFYQNREWPYKNVKPRIICEVYMVDESGYELKDYKWFCFNGEIKALFIASDRENPQEETKFDFFDENFNHLPFTNGHPNSKKVVKKPKGFETMKEIATKLSQNIPHVRIDLYDINGQIYFGEMTFFHWSGMVPFNPEKWDYTFGEWIKLPPKNTNKVSVQK
ncbi:MAG: glycosyl transferase [Ruminococcus sp.]|nr:glycosyl transferase [Ruminococcus sp.]